MEATNTPNDTIQDFLANGRVYEIRAASKYVNLTVVLGKDASLLTTQKGRDGKWRYTTHSTYGNVHHIWSGDVNDPTGGGAYDASGYVITDPNTIGALEALTKWPNAR